MLCYALIRAGMARRILLVGADRMSATINWRDRGFATVLGDAGTATLCVAVPESEDWFSPAQFWSWLDGTHADIIRTPAGGSRQPSPSAEELDTGQHRLMMVALRTGDIVNPMIRSAGILIPDGAGRQTLSAGFGQIEAQVMKVGMVAEASCISKPWAF